MTVSSQRVDNLKPLPLSPQKSLKNVEGQIILPKFFRSNVHQQVQSSSASESGASRSESRTPSPAQATDFPLVKKIRKPSGSLAAGDGPTLRVSQDANKVLGVSIDFDKHWKFPDTLRSSNGDWPLPPEGVLMSAVTNEEVTSSGEESADSKRIVKARRGTLAKLEGMIVAYDNYSDTDWCKGRCEDDYEPTVAGACASTDLPAETKVEDEPPGNSQESVKADKLDQSFASLLSTSLLLEQRQQTPEVICRPKLKQPSQLPSLHAARSFTQFTLSSFRHQQDGQEKFKPDRKITKIPIASRSLGSPDISPLAHKSYRVKNEPAKVCWPKICNLTSLTSIGFDQTA